MNVQLNCVTQPRLPAHELGLDYGAVDMSPEEYMIYCARVSSPSNRLNHETAPRLLKYLIEHKHWSPFEMISLGFEVKTSRAIAQQIIRHRSFSFQEFSQRYARVEALEPLELRKQAETNRQSSREAFDTDDALYAAVEAHLAAGQALYEDLIDNNVAKECARMVLPLTTQTTIVMHGTLRSWIHFLEQRCDDHAQKEIRLIAKQIQAKLAEVCPWTAAAMGWAES